MVYLPATAGLLAVFMSLLLVAMVAGCVVVLPFIRSLIGRNAVHA